MHIQTKNNNIQAKHAKSQLSFLQKQVDILLYDFTINHESLLSSISYLQEIVSSEYRTFLEERLEFYSKRISILKARLFKNLEKLEREEKVKLVHSITYATERKEGLEILLSENIAKKIMDIRKTGEHFRKKKTSASS